MKGEKAELQIGFEKMVEDILLKGKSTQDIADEQGVKALKPL